MGNPVGETNIVCGMRNIENVMIQILERNRLMWKVTSTSLF